MFIDPVSLLLAAGAAACMVAAGCWINSDPREQEQPAGPSCRERLGKLPAPAGRTAPAPAAPERLTRLVRFARVNRRARMVLRGTKQGFAALRDW